MAEQVMRTGGGVDAHSCLATLETFWEFAQSDSGIVTLVGVAVSVALGCLALYCASRHQRATAADMRANQAQVLGQFAVMASLLGPGISEVVAQSIGDEAAQETAPVPVREPAAATRGENEAGDARSETGNTRYEFGNPSPVVAADVIGAGQMNLVVQNRDSASTTLRVLAFDSEFRPRLIGALATDRRARFATSDDVPAVVSTLEKIEHDHAKLTTYRWTGQRLAREGEREVSLSDPGVAALLWPT